VPSSSSRPSFSSSSSVSSSSSPVPFPHLPSPRSSARLSLSHPRTFSIPIRRQAIQEISQRYQNGETKVIQAVAKKFHINLKTLYKWRMAAKKLEEVSARRDGKPRQRLSGGGRKAFLSDQENDHLREWIIARRRECLPVGVESLLHQLTLLRPDDLNPLQDHRKLITGFLKRNHMAIHVTHSFLKINSIKVCIFLSLIFLSVFFLPSIAHFNCSRRTATPLRTSSNTKATKQLSSWLMCLFMSRPTRSSPARFGRFASFLFRSFIAIFSCLNVDLEFGRNPISPIVFDGPCY
jgi:hypothetical protein